jgi:drug/metabolite transporter (DMT)-like permease
MAVGFFWFGETISAASLVGLLAIAAGGMVTLADPQRLKLPVAFGIRPRIA